MLSININRHLFHSVKPMLTRTGWRFLFLLFPLLYGTTIQAQPTPFPPPKQIQVSAEQDLSFGSFHTGTTGGTVVVSPSGMRSTTGTVVIAGGVYYAAVFVVELLPGRLVSIQLGPTITMNRIGGGGSMTMTVGPTDKGLQFVTSGGHPFRNTVMVGGTLHVGNTSANPPGDYSGEFTITFIQE
jgi:hypothetical protein